MQALRVPARRGLDWITEGYRLFTRNPIVVVSLICGFLFFLGVSALLSFPGTCAMAVLLPALSVGLLIAFKRLDTGEPIALQNLFAGFQSNFPALLRLGFLYLAMIVFALLLSTFADGGLYFKEVVLGDAPPEPAPVVFGQAQAVFYLALFPGMVAIWFAPMLASWHRLPALQSAFFGLIACLRNYRAFLVYFAAMLGICLMIVALIATVAELAGGAKEETARVLLVPVMIVLFAIVTAANYLSYRDIFRDDAPAAEPADAPAQ